MQTANVDKMTGIKEKYDRDGYVVFSSVIDDVLVQEARSHL